MVATSLGEFGLGLPEFWHYGRARVLSAARAAGVDAAERAGTGAISVDGQLVDAAHMHQVQITSNRPRKRAWYDPRLPVFARQAATADDSRGVATVEACAPHNELATQHVVPAGTRGPPSQALRGLAVLGSLQTHKGQGG